MPNELIPYKTATRQVTPDLWQMISTIASEAHKAHTLGVTSQADAAMKILTGHEVGLPAMASLRVIYNIKAKAAIQPKGAWALIVSHPEFAGMAEERLVDDKDKFLGYAITLKRKNGVQARRQFTLADAARAGLIDKDNWRGYPEHCCFWRAMAFVQDVVFPDVLMGLSRADELGAAIDSQGNVVEGEWQTLPPQQPAAAPAPTTPTLDSLVEQYGAERVMEAAGGRIPGTVAEVAETARVLAETGDGDATN